MASENLVQHFSLCCLCMNHSEEEVFTILRNPCKVQTQVQTPSIVNMIKNRHLTLAHKDITKRIRITRIYPQGGILSPFIWNLVVDGQLAEGSDAVIIWQRTQKIIIERSDTKGLNINALSKKVCSPGIGAGRKSGPVRDPVNGSANNI